MALQLSSSHLKTIFDHAERIYPEECCGLLLGRCHAASSDDQQGSPDEDKEVIEIWETPNTWNEDVEASLESLSDTGMKQSLTKSRRYWIDPRDTLAAQKYARDRQLDIVGIYHSHPDHPAIPSECDRAAAWSCYSYLIVSVHHGKANHVLSWTLDEQDQFQSEEIHAVASVEV